MTEQRVPELVKAHEIGVGTASEMLLVGDNLERIRSEAALAKLKPANPSPAAA